MSLLPQWQAVWMRSQDGLSQLLRRGLGGQPALVCGGRCHRVYLSPPVTLPPLHCESAPHTQLIWGAWIVVQENFPPCEDLRRIRGQSEIFSCDRTKAEDEGKLCTPFSWLVGSIIKANIYWGLTIARYFAKHFIFVISFNVLSNSIKYILSSFPFYRWGNWDIKGLRNCVHNVK